MTDIALERADLCIHTSCSNFCTKCTRLKTVSSESHCANLQNDLVPYASWYQIGSKANLHHSLAKQRHKLGSKRSGRLDQAVFSDL